MALDSILHIAYYERAYGVSYSHICIFYFKWDIKICRFCSRSLFQILHGGGGIFSLQAPVIKSDNGTLNTQQVCDRLQKTLQSLRINKSAVVLLHRR